MRQESALQINVTMGVIVVAEASRNRRDASLDSSTIKYFAKAVTVVK